MTWWCVSQLCYLQGLFWLASVIQFLFLLFFYSFIKTFSQLPRDHQFFSKYKRKTLFSLNAPPLPSLHPVTTDVITCLLDKNPIQGKNAFSVSCYIRPFTSWPQMLFEIYHLSLCSCVGHTEILSVLSHPFHTRCSLLPVLLPLPPNSGVPKVLQTYWSYKRPGEITTFLRIILQLPSPAAFSEPKIYTFIIALPFKNPVPHLPLPWTSFCIHITKVDWSY